MTDLEFIRAPYQTLMLNKIDGQVKSQAAWREQYNANGTNIATLLEFANHLEFFVDEGK